MVTTDPRSIDARRQWKEALIRVVDIVAYLAVLIGGVGALMYTPVTVQSALHGWPGLIILWGVLLIVGGLFGFIGRFTRIWAIETPGTSAAIAGVGIFLIILIMAVHSIPTALVAGSLVAIAALTLVRRSLELHILTSEPGAKVKFTSKVRTILQRRTSNTVSKHR